MRVIGWTILSPFSRHHRIKIRARTVSGGITEKRLSPFGKSRSPLVRLWKFHQLTISTFGYSGSIRGSSQEYFLRHCYSYRTGTGCYNRPGIRAGIPVGSSTDTGFWQHSSGNHKCLSDKCSIHPSSFRFVGSGPSDRHQVPADIPGLQPDAEGRLHGCLCCTSCRCDTRDIITRLDRV